MNEENRRAPNEEKRAQAFIALYKQQMTRFNQTQQVEWKGNFGMWTLLAGAIYLAKEKSLSLSFCAAAIPLFVVTLLHFWWLYKIHQSEKIDKMLWVQYRHEALEILRHGEHAIPAETDSGRSLAQDLSWLLVEVGITILLCAMVLLVLAKRP